MSGRWPPAASAVCSFGVQALLVVQGVLIARSLGPAARGDLGWIQWAPPLVTVIAFFGLTQAIPALSGGRPERREAYFWTGITIALSLALVLAGVTALIFFTWRLPEPQIVALGILFLLSSPLEVVFAFPRDYLVAEHDFQRHDLLKLLLGAMTCGAIAMLAAWHAVSVASIVCAMLAASALMGVVTWFLIPRRLLHRQFATPAETKQLLHFGLLCLGAGFAGVVQTRLLQLQVGTAFGPIGLGLFIVAMTWGGLGGAVWQVVQVRFYPALAAAVVRGEGRKMFRRAFQIGLALTAVAIVAGYAITPSVFPLLMGEKYAGGIELARAFAIAAPFQAFGTFMGFCIRAMGFPGRALLSDYIGAGMTVLAAFVIIRCGLTENALAAATGVGGLASIVIAGTVGFRKA